jgi:hypothetical protein
MSGGPYGYFSHLGKFLHLDTASGVAVMTHPGSLRRLEETKLLQSDWTSRLSYNAFLVSYKSL